MFLHAAAHAAWALCYLGDDEETGLLGVLGSTLNRTLLAKVIANHIS